MSASHRHVSTLISISFLFLDQEKPTSGKKRTRKVQYLLDRPVGLVEDGNMPRPVNTARRDALIEIASQLFYEQGYGATGIKQIIESCGIAKGTFYSHFESKEALGVAWLESRHQQWVDSTSETSDSTKKPSARLLALFDHLKNWMEETSYRGCAFLNTASEIPESESPLHSVISKHKEASRQWLRELVVDCFPKKNTKEVAAQADVFYLLIEGALAESQLRQAEWPIKTAKDEVQRQLKAG